MTQEFKAYQYGPASGGDPKQIVLLLHGLGANGQDLIGLAPEFSDTLPDAMFISPDAPFPCDMAPMGYQWFSLQSRDPEDMLKGIKIAQPMLEEFISAILKEYNLPADKLALLGFSQGTMMSLYVGPRYKDKLAGIMGYSGALVWEDDVQVERLTKIPVELVHGDSDDVVPVTAYHHAREVLEKSGFSVSGTVVPGLSHGIDYTGIAAGKEFLSRVLL